MALKPLSLRAYARHRKELGLPGTSLQAVQRAIAAGRVADSLVVVDGIKRIADPEAADREWHANTDPLKAPGEPGGDDAESSSPLLEAAGREKHFRAQLAELDYLKRSGELVDAGEVKAGFVELCTAARNRMLGLPSRMKQAHPDLTREQIATLDRLLREDLQELAAE